MRKHLLILFALLGFSMTIVHAQAVNTIYGKDVVISTRDTSSAELTIKNSTRTVQGYLKNASGTGKTMFAFPAWSEILSKPSNFNTTYALSNDVKDSILKRLAIRDTSSMLNAYKTGIIALNADTATLATRFSNIVSLVGTKVNISDTSSMLNAYKVKNIAQDASLALKVNFTDTSSMLSAYRLKDISHDASITALNNDTATLAARFTNVINLANSRQAALGYTPENVANKNAANGYAGLDAGGKVPFSLLPATLMIYKGLWDATTNSPSLSNGVGTAGHVYKISNSGGQYYVGNRFGVVDTLWNDDFIIYNGTAWEVSGETNNVKSVNNQQGIVTLTTANIAENTNLYYTDARVLSYGNTQWIRSVVGTAGKIFSTGGSNPTLTIDAAYNGQSSITNVGTLTIGTWNATPITDTYISSASTWNAKQPQLNGTGFVKASGTTISYDNSSYLTGNQTITLSGDISGSGTTAITTTIGASKVTNAMLAGSIDYSKMNAATVPTWNQNTTGSATQWSGWTQDYGSALSTAPTGLFGYNTGTTVQRIYNATALSSFLGLGSAAYNNSGDFVAYRTFGTAANNNSGDFYANGSTVANSTLWNSQSYDGSVFNAGQSAIMGYNNTAGKWTYYTAASIASFISGQNINTTGTAANVTGVVAVANGGTGLTSLVSNYIYKGNGTSAIVASNIYDDGTNIGIGTNAPQAGIKMDVRSDGTVAGSSAVAGYGYNGAGGAGIRGIGYATSGTGNNYGIIGESSGSRAAGANYGGYFLAAGAPTNYGVYSAGGLNYFAGATTFGDALTGTTASFSSTLGVTGITTLTNLAGSGDRMVVANSSGVLSTQAIPSSSDFVPYVGATSSLDMGAYYVQANSFTSTSNIYNSYQTFPVTALNTNYLLSGAGRGMLRISDHTYGGTALYLIDFITGTFTTIASNLVGTYTLVFSSGQWYLRKTAGSVPSTIGWTMYQ